VSISISAVEFPYLGVFYNFSSARMADGSEISLEVLVFDACITTDTKVNLPFNFSSWFYFNVLWQVLYAITSDEKKNNILPPAFLSIYNNSKTPSPSHSPTPKESPKSSYFMEPWELMLQLTGLKGSESEKIKKSNTSVKKKLSRQSVLNMFEELETKTLPSVTPNVLSEHLKRSASPKPLWLVDEEDEEALKDDEDGYLTADEFYTGSKSSASLNDTIRTTGSKNSILRSASMPVSSIPPPPPPPPPINFPATMNSSIPPPPPPPPPPMSGYILYFWYDVVCF
jgi:hypothetical protein